MTTRGHYVGAAIVGTLGFMVTKKFLGWLSTITQQQQRQQVVDDVPYSSFCSTATEVAAAAAARAQAEVHSGREEKRDGASETNSPPQTRFPWEPKALIVGDNSDNNNDSLPLSNSSSTPTKSTTKIDKDTLAQAQYHLQELEFLAAMTFANGGGLRAPVCLCCQ